MMKKFLLFTISFAFLLAPTSNYAQLTPAYDDIYIPLTDPEGDSLQADVYIPSAVTSGEVILIQTPYNKDLFAWWLPMGVGLDLDTQPFIWVIVDWQGFYGSNPFDATTVDRAQDAFDVCEWIVAQPWCDGRIGTWGPSALGGIQYQLITKSHPNHVCAVPMVATGSQDYEQYFYGGVLEEARLNQLDALGYGLGPIVLANHYDGLLWDIAAAGSDYAPQIDIPTLQIGGWYDHQINGMMDFYTSSRNDAAPPILDEQWLLVGPWVHGGTGAAYVGSAVQGELTYPNAEFVSDTMAWDFMLYYLLDSVNGWDLTDKITYYELGTDQWLTTNADNIDAVGSEVLYLNPANKLSSENGVGSSTFISDPTNASPTIGGATLSDLLDQGPYDQNSLDSRTDIVAFETVDLLQDVTMTGRMQLDLWISADQPDCDIAVRVCDKYPDGRSMLITDGIKRLRFRNGDYSASGEEFMTAGTVYNVQVDLPYTNYSWLAGHQIKIYLSGNHDVRFNVNLQDGGPMYTAGAGNVANITIHHDAAYPSRINLPGTNPVLAYTEIERSDEFKIYPQPGTDQLFFITERDFSSYSIVDLSGRKVETQKIQESRIDIATLESGTYILILKDQEGRSLQQRFIKI
jgi:uncharacterized protein